MRGIGIRRGLLCLKKKTCRECTNVQASVKASLVIIRAFVAEKKFCYFRIKFTKSKENACFSSDW